MKAAPLYGLYFGQQGGADALHRLRRCNGRALANVRVNAVPGP